MITKPPEGWGRESPVISSARSVAQGSLTTARAGGHLLRAIPLLGFAGLWGFAALASGAFGSFPTFFGAGAMSLAAGWAGLRALKKARGVIAPESAQATPPAPIARSGQPPLRRISYDRDKLIRSAAVCGVLAFVGLFCLRVGGMLTLISAVGTPFAAMLAVLSLKRAFGDLDALVVERDGLTVATLWSRRTVTWSEVAEVGVRRVNTYAMWGLVRTSTTETLVVKVRGGLLGQTRLSVLPKLLDMGPLSLEALVQMLEQARTGTTPSAPMRPVASPTPSPSLGAPVGGSTLSPGRPAFGRKAA